MAQMSQTLARRDCTSPKSAAQAQALDMDFENFRRAHDESKAELRLVAPDADSGEYSLGDEVKFRDQGRAWEIGYVTNVSPLRCDTDPDGRGERYDEVKKLDQTEAMNAREERKANGGADGHMFSEEGVNREKQRSMDNIANLRDVLEKQDFVYRTIMDKVQQGAEAPQRARRERADSRESARKASPYLHRDDESIRVQHACHVANEQHRRKERTDAVRQKKSELALDDEKYLQSLVTKHEAYDQQVVRRQQKIVERQLEKTFIAQQKRNEQQKMMKELQRDQDHQFEVLQLKHHPAAVSTQKHPGHHAPTEMAPPKTPAGEPARMLRTCSEPIYDQMCQSHQLYSTTLTKWRDFEADNERRTEAYWRKMGQEHPRRRDATMVKEQRGLNVFRQAAKTITTIRSFVKRARDSVCYADGELPGAGLLFDEGDSYDAIDTTHMSEPSLDLTMSGRARSSTDGGVRGPYEERRETVKAFQRSQERKATEKALQDKTKLEQKRANAKQVQDEKTARVREGIKVWEQKNEATQQKRDELAVKDSGHFDAKMADAAERAKDEQERIDQALLRSSDAAAAKLREIREKQDNATQEKVEKFKAQQSEKGARGDELLEIRLKKAMANNGYSEIVKQKCEQKRQFDRDFRKKTVEEITFKEERSRKSLKRSTTRSSVNQVDAAQVLEKQRQVKKTRSRKLTEIDCSLPPELALPEHLFLSPKCAGKTSSLAAEANPFFPQEGVDSPTAEQLEREVDAVNNTMMMSRRASTDRKSTWSKASQSPSSMLSISGGMGSSDANLGASGGEKSEGSGRDSDEESEGEANFLEDIRVKSSKWLQDMRKSAADNLSVGAV